jgi:hypothetical protein
MYKPAQHWSEYFGTLKHSQNFRYFDVGRAWETSGAESALGAIVEAQGVDRLLPNCSWLLRNHAAWRYAKALKWGSFVVEVAWRSSGRGNIHATQDLVCHKKHWDWWW